METKTKSMYIRKYVCVHHFELFFFSVALRDLFRIRNVPIDTALYVSRHVESVVLCRRSDHDGAVL